MLCLLLLLQMTAACVCLSESVTWSSQHSIRSESQQGTAWLLYRPSRNSEQSSRLCVECTLCVFEYLLNDMRQSPLFLLAIFSVNVGCH